MLKNGYAVCHDDNPGQIPPSIISSHRVLARAQAAFRRRNRHLFDSRFAQQHGMQNAGSFDVILELQDGRLGEAVPWRNEVG